MAEPGANPAAGSGQKVGQESQWGVGRANSLPSLSIYYLSLSLFLVGFLQVPVPVPVPVIEGINGLLTDSHVDPQKLKRVNGVMQRAKSLDSLSIHYLSLVVFLQVPVWR